MDSFEVLKDLYSQIEEKRGKEAYKYVLELLQRAQELREAYLDQHQSDKDKGQSSRSSNGKNFEKLIQHIITEPLEALGLKVVNGNTLERRADRNLSEELRQVKQNLLIDYSEFEPLLPDADIIIYKPENSEVIAILSSKVSLRERITHTGYWKFKILKSQQTEHIKLYLITLDKDKHLMKREHPKKQRIIAEIDLDGTYVLTAEELEESEKVKLFEHFIEDLKQVMEESQ